MALCKLHQSKKIKKETNIMNELEFVPTEAGYNRLQAKGLNFEYNIVFEPRRVILYARIGDDRLEIHFKTVEAAKEKANALHRLRFPTLDGEMEEKRRKADKLVEQAEMLLKIAKANAAGLLINVDSERVRLHSIRIKVDDIHNARSTCKVKDVKILG